MLGVEASPTSTLGFLINFECTPSNSTNYQYFRYQVAVLYSPSTECASIALYSATDRA